jgi:hypothetical protein
VISLRWPEYAAPDVHSFDSGGELQFIFWRTNGRVLGFCVIGKY